MHKPRFRIDDSLPPNWKACAQPREVTVWATPDTPVRMKVAGGVPKFVVCRLLPKGGGEYALKPLTLDLWMKKGLGFCRRMGIDLSDDTLMRLCVAGFVQARFPSPFVVLVHVGSLMEHLLNAKHSTWWTRARRLQYLSACDDIQRAKEAKKRKTS